MSLPRDLCQALPATERRQLARGTWGHWRALAATPATWRGVVTAPGALHDLCPGFEATVPREYAIYTDGMGYVRFSRDAHLVYNHRQGSGLVTYDVDDASKWVCDPGISSVYPLTDGSLLVHPMQGGVLLRRNGVDTPMNSNLSKIRALANGVLVAEILGRGLCIQRKTRGWVTIWPGLIVHLCVEGNTLLMLPGNATNPMLGRYRGGALTWKELPCEHCPDTIILDATGTFAATVTWDTGRAVVYTVATHRVLWEAQIGVLMPCVVALSPRGTFGCRYFGNHDSTLRIVYGDTQRTFQLVTKDSPLHWARGRLWFTVVTKAGWRQVCSLPE